MQLIVVAHDIPPVVFERIQYKHNSESQVKSKLKPFQKKGSRNIVLDIPVTEHKQLDTSRKKLKFDIFSSPNIGVGRFYMYCMSVVPIFVLAIMRKKGNKKVVYGVE